ncbi:DUF2922 domain-containing protein [Tissierella sp.]|uniref:DUF2922 domain-containing protein n=1 Tax=Tissierella sp. TaxID=41274 RepID=UPI002860C32F|nr:DUF2922 domain-containing protein [Tissierella sp.]MDR7857508.1 DUF2922 domain-containing protein [Tissierella sp.]
MNKTKLEMEFLDAANKKFVISLDDPRSDITPEEVGDAMDTIVSYNVFASSLQDLVVAKEARIVATAVSTLEI